MPLQADAPLWVHTLNFIAGATIGSEVAHPMFGISAEKFFGDLKGAFFKKPPFLFGVSFDSFSLRLLPAKKSGYGI